MEALQWIYILYVEKKVKDVERKLERKVTLPANIGVMDIMTNERGIASVNIECNRVIGLLSYDAVVIPKCVNNTLVVETYSVETTTETYDIRGDYLEHIHTLKPKPQATVRVVYINV